LNYNESALQRVRQDRLLIDHVDDWLLELVEHHLGQRILEIGCGLGNFSRHFANRQMYVGVDTSADSVEAVKSEYSGYDNVDAFVADATDQSFLDLAQYQFDTVFSLNVFEHISDDTAAIQNAATVLEPGGNLILLVPAHDWLFGSIDRSIGHYRRYNKHTLGKKLSQAGLRCRELRYVNMVGAMGWIVSGRLLKRQTPPSGQLRLFNKIVPLLKRFEKAVRVPFGITLLSVYTKDQ